MSFTTTMAKAGGVRRSRLRAADLYPVFHGVRSQVDGSQLHDKVRSLVTVLPEGAAISHHTCAALLEIPLPSNTSADVHVTVPPGSNRVRRPGLVVHRADRPHLLRDGVQLVAPAPTWCDLAEYLGLTDLVIAGDDILHRGLAPFDILRDTAATHSSRRGARVRRAALDLLRAESASPMETTARLRFGLWGLPEPELNVPIIHAGGWIATVDFLWRTERVILEYYGEVHQQSWRNDLARTAALEDAGYQVVVITHCDLRAADADLYQRLVGLLGVCSRVVTSAQREPPATMHS